jgi:hypothetical protein
MGVEGVSVTIPLLDALRVASSSDALTQRVGAATPPQRPLWLEARTLTSGFLQPLGWPGFTSWTAFPRVRAGAGGSARAVIVARARGAHVTVHASVRIRQGLRRASMSGRCVSAESGRGICWSAARRLASRGGGVADAGRQVDRPSSTLTYGSAKGALRDARSAGLKTLDGLSMLVAQAERQFEWWTGASRFLE